MLFFDDKNKIKQIPIDQVSNELFEIRQPRQVETMLKLESSIREEGIVEPLLLMKTGKRAYEVVAGSRRLEAARNVGLETIPAVIVPEAERESYAISLLMALLQEPLSLYEKSLVMNEIVTQRIMSKSKLIEYLDVSTPYAEKLFAIKDVNPTVKYALNSFQITEAECFYLMSLPENEQEKVLEKMVRDVRHESYRDVLQLHSNKTNKESLTLAVNTLQRAVDLISKTQHPFTYESEETKEEVIYTIRIQK